MKGFGRIYSRGMLAFVVYLFFAVSYFAVSDLKSLAFSFR